MKVAKNIRCRVCDEKLTTKNTHKSNIKLARHVCKACYMKYDRPLRRRYNRELKADIIAGYGGKCACCGEKKFEFLTIDHKHGGGEAHRIKLGNSHMLYRLLKKENYPRREYQLLCMNCNFAKGHYGICPHKKEAK